MKGRPYASLTESQEAGTSVIYMQDQKKFTDMARFIKKLGDERVSCKVDFTNSIACGFWLSACMFHAWSLANFDFPNMSSFAAAHLSRCSRIQGACR